MPDYVTNVEEQENGKRKTFTYWLMYNYKTHDINLYSREPSEKKEGPYDIVQKVETTIKHPEKKQYHSKQEINIPKGKMKEMTVEEL